MTIPRLGFAGVGWAGAMRLDAVVAAGRAQVAALCDPSPATLEKVAAAHPEAAPFADLDALLAKAGDLGLDGLVVATPNALHAPQTLAALDRGLAVFCQKPLALSAAEAREVVGAARRAGRLLGVDYSYLHTDGAAALHRAIAAGELGRVFSVDAAFHNGYGPDKAWCRDLALAGGGALIDLGVHLIDLALWLLGNPPVREVAGTTFREGRPLAGRGLDDFASLRFTVDGGAAVTAAVSWNAHAGRDCAIRAAAFGTGGGAELRNVGGGFYDYELERFRGRSGEVVVRSTESLAGALLAWAERLGRGEGYDPAVERSVAVAEVVDAVYGERGPYRA